MTDLAPGPGRGRTIAVASAALVLTAPGQTAAISVLVNPIETELELSGSTVSGAYLIGSLAGAWALPLLGRAIDRWGPRPVMAAVGAAFGTVLILLSAVSGLVGLTAGFIGIRMLGQGALSLVATTAVALYIDHRRGLAQGIVAAIGGAGISLAPVLLEGVVSEHGFRQVWLWEGILVLALVVPLGLFGLPPRPGEPRQVPRVRGEEIEEPVQAVVHPTILGRPGAVGDATLSEALRTPMFWLVTLGVALTGMIGTALAFHQIDILGERGLSPAAAAANFLPQTAAGLAATVLVGHLADRFADQVLIAAALVVLAVAVFAAGYVSPGWTVLGYAIAAGSAGNAIRTLEATAFPNCFGLAHLGAIRGVVHATAVAATAFGPFLFSLARGATDSYRPVLLAAAVPPLLLAATAPFVRPPQRSRATADNVRGQ